MHAEIVWSFGVEFREKVEAGDEAVRVISLNKRYVK